MRLIDTHCHPQFEQYDTDREAVIKRSLEAGIGMVCIGTSVADSLEAIRLAEKYPHDPVYATVGIHPNDDDIHGVHPQQLQVLMGSQKIVGVGETGLDYFRLTDPESLTLQADLFEQHVLFAAEHDLPLVIHVRDNPGTFNAYDDVLAVLTRHQVKRFVMHCFSADWAHAEKFLTLGGTLSFTGIITFPKSEVMRDVVKKTPLERMMVETDAPFLAPVPHRGERNEPGYVQFVAETIAKLRGEPIDDIARATTSNAQAFFRLPTIV